MLTTVGNCEEVRDDYAELMRDKMVWASPFSGLMEFLVAGWAEESLGFGR